MIKELEEELGLKITEKDPRLRSLGKKVWTNN
jgi:hypothetical protein